MIFAPLRRALFTLLLSRADAPAPIPLRFEHITGEFIGIGTMEYRIRQITGAHV